MNELENLFKNALSKEQDEEAANQALAELRELVESGCKELITNPEVMQDIEKSFAGEQEDFKFAQRIIANLAIYEGFCAWFYLFIQGEQEAPDKDDLDGFLAAAGEGFFNLDFFQKDMQETLVAETNKPGGAFSLYSYAYCVASIAKKALYTLAKFL